MKAFRGGYSFIKRSFKFSAKLLSTNDDNEKKKASLIQIILYCLVILDSILYSIFYFIIVEIYLIYDIFEVVIKFLDRCPVALQRLFFALLFLFNYTKLDQEILLLMLAEIKFLEVRLSCVNKKR